MSITEKDIEEALKVAYEPIEALMKNWCKQSGVQCIFYTISNLHKEITVYTNKPGCLIGKYGKNIDEFKEKIKELTGYEYTILIKEIKGKAMIMEKPTWNT